MYWQTARYVNKENGVWYDLAKPVKIEEGPYIDNPPEYHRLVMESYDAGSTWSKVQIVCLLVIVACMVVNTFYLKNPYIWATLFAISIPLDRWRVRRDRQDAARRAYLQALSGLAYELRHNSYTGVWL